MPRNRFVTGLDTVKLDLSDGDFLIVKQELSFGEQSKLQHSSIRSMRTTKGDLNDETIFDLTMDAYELERFCAWIVDWSLCDAKGRVVDIGSPHKKRQAMLDLNTETATEIKDALDAHISALEEAKKARQPRNGNATSGNVIELSPSAAGSPAGSPSTYGSVPSVSSTGSSTISETSTNGVPPSVPSGVELTP